MIKVVTGIRRCGKSFLLFRLYTDYLISLGVAPDHIIHVDLEDRRNKSLRDPDNLLQYIDGKMSGEGMYYIMVDEIQHVVEFEDVLNSYLKIENADVYVTGSNARFLSKDVITTFRGRGDEIHVYPLSFSEFMSVFDGTKQRGLDTYMLYGGMPQVLELPNPVKKSEYLKTLFSHTYLRDIKDRYNIQNEDVMEDLLNIISSAIGSLTNPIKLSDTICSVKHERIDPKTIRKYLEYLCDAFLTERAERYDVKGKRYINSPYKYYFTDLGLRNARLNFRQNEPTHIMENIIYNELKVRGFNVDVGIVPITTINAEGRRTRSQLEIDFVCNQGSRRYYIQSAYRMPDIDKVRQEEASLLHVDDSFKKIIVISEEINVRHTENGITIMGIYDFLLNPNSLEF